MPVDPSQLDSTIAKIKSMYSGKTGGTGRAIQMGDEEPPVDRISTGSLELDYATGGGIPIGRWSRFYGGWSSGKSMTCWNIIKNAQQMGMTCAYYNVEKQYTKEFASAMGVNVNDLVVVQGTVIEEIAIKMESLFSSVHLHVIDSCSSAVSIDELDAKITEWRPGISARAWGKVFRHVGEFFDDNENCVILVDQVRDSFSMGKPEPPGGKAFEHINSMGLEFRRGNWLFRNKKGILDYEGSDKTNTLSGMTEPDGIEIQVRCEKSRVSRPFRTARIRYGFEQRDVEGTTIIHEAGIDEIYELEKLARWFNIIEKTSPQSSYYKRADGKPFSDGSQTKQGTMQLRIAIQDDKELQDHIRNTVLKSI